MESEGSAVYDVLYWSPRPKLVKPTRLSYFDPSMGFVYIRSDWDSPDATLSIAGLSPSFCGSGVPE
jgi:hypothetical protein